MMYFTAYELIEETTDNNKTTFAVEKARNNRGELLQIPAAAPLYSLCNKWAEMGTAWALWQKVEAARKAETAVKQGLDAGHIAELEQIVKDGDQKTRKDGKKPTAEQIEAAAAALEVLTDYRAKCGKAEAIRKAWEAAAEQIGAEAQAENARKNTALAAFLAIFDYRKDKGAKTLGRLHYEDGTDFISRATKDADTLADIAVIRDYMTKYPATVQAWGTKRKDAFKDAKAAVDRIAARYCHDDSKPTFKPSFKASHYEEAITGARPVTVTVKGGTQGQRPAHDDEVLRNVLKACMDHLTEKPGKTPAPDQHSGAARNAAQGAAQTGKNGGKKTGKTGKAQPKTDSAAKQEAPKQEAPKQ